MQPNLPVAINPNENSSVIAHMQAGEVVYVKEIAVSPEDGQLLRGRLDVPPGWISLEHVGTGISWAAKQRSGPVVMHGLLEGGRIGLTLSQQLIVTHLADPRAAQYGWGMGDRVLKVNGAHVRGEDDFLDALQQAIMGFKRCGQPLVFDIKRGVPHSSKAF
mmetsp:Transcript_48527/g.112727  ORF Transcript_48527/g.112727 Transcript_48527/m.112727 type:complete len:161 (+) Transcript_48527:2-484(+)